MNSIASRFALLSLVGLSAPIAHAADMSLAGFGSIVAGKVMSGDGYIANFRDLGIYGKHGAGALGPDSQGYLNPETRFGVQGSVGINEAAKLTVQAVARGSDDYSPKVTWAYLTWKLAPSVNVQAGKMGIPVYQFSDKMDVGFAYPWLRVPADAYSLEATSVSGARITHQGALANVAVTTTLWSGTSSGYTPLMSYLFSAPISRDNTFKGIVSEASFGPAQLRLSYTKNNLKQRTTDATQGFRNEDFKNSFIDVAAQYELGDLTLIAEWNKDKPFYTSWFISGVYQFGTNAFYVTRSKFILDEPWEKHPTWSVGVRHDIGSNMALKFDVTRMTDQGMNPFSGARNPVIKIAPGDATIASVGIDFVF